MPKNDFGFTPKQLLLAIDSACRKMNCQPSISNQNTSELVIDIQVTEEQHIRIWTSIGKISKQLNPTGKDSLKLVLCTKEDKRWGIKHLKRTKTLPARLREKLIFLIGLMKELKYCPDCNSRMIFMSRRKNNQNVLTPICSSTCWDKESKVA